MFAQSVPLFPPQASTSAVKVDALLVFLCAVCGLMAVMVATLIFYYAVRYRRRGTQDHPTPRILGSTGLELFWTIAPFFVFLVMFVWGADVFFGVTRPPDDALQVYVVGK